MFKPILVEFSVTSSQKHTKWIHYWWENKSSASFHEGAVFVLEVLWLEYGVKLAGVWEEDAEGLVQLYWLNELEVVVPRGEMLHETIFENGKHEQDEE